MSLINVNVSQIEEYGKSIYKKNPIFADIAHFMEHPQSKDFYKKYLQTKGDSEGMIFLLALYNSIEDNDDINAYHKLAVLDKMIGSSEIRHKMVQLFQNGNLLMN